MKAMLVLQSDFSLDWPAVAEMKGVIKQVDRDLEIFDGCHRIKPFDSWEASLNLQALENYWPQGTIFISVVDPGVGSDRKAAVAKLKDGNYVVSPDNGSLTHMKEEVGIEEVREIDPSLHRYPRGEEVAVFDGRDLFAYCGAKLASGKISFEEVGPAYPVDQVVECKEYQVQPVLENNRAEGFIMTGLWRFGGVQFNIKNKDWDKTHFKEGQEVRIQIANKGKLVFDQAVSYAKTFSQVPQGDPVLYKGSSGFLSLDCNQDHFMNRFHVRTGLDWTVQISPANTKKI